EVPQTATTRSVARSQGGAGREAERRGGHRPGQGRLGAEAYAGAERLACRHEELRVGERCPVCGQGRLYALPPGVEMRIDGNALLSAIRYEVEKRRCSAGGAVFTAQLPKEAGAEKYSPRARAGGGAPIWGCRCPAWKAIKPCWGARWLMPRSGIRSGGWRPVAMWCLPIWNSWQRRAS